MRSVFAEGWGSHGKSYCHADRPNHRAPSTSVSGILCASDEACPYEVTTTEAEETVRTEPQGALSWASN